MAKQVKKNVKKEVKKEIKKEEKKVVKFEVKKAPKRSFKAWWLVGLLLPPLGLVLYIMWRKNRKDDAKSVGTGALVSALIWLFFGLSFLIHTNGEQKKGPVTVAEWLESYENGEDLVTVVASSTCPHCQNLKPVITESSEKYGYKLFFFEADTLGEEDYNTLTTTIELEGYEGYVPFTFVVSNKKFMGSHTGEMEDEDLTEFLKETKILK